MSETNIVKDVLDVFRAAGFEVRTSESEFDKAGRFAIVGSIDSAGILMESVCEHFGSSAEAAFSCAQREKEFQNGGAHAGVVAAEPIADLAEFMERSIREHADFREDVERLSTADSRTRKALRKEIYDTIDARVRNAVKAALAAPAAQSPVQNAEEVRPQWISVADQLPEDGEQVLVLCPDTGCEPAIWSAHWLSGSKTFESNSNGWADLEDISHWMPRPAVPEQSAQGEKGGNGE